MKNAACAPVNTCAIEKFEFKNPHPQQWTAATCMHAASVAAVDHAFNSLTI